MVKYLIDTKTPAPDRKFADFNTLEEARGFAIFLLGMKTYLDTVPIFSHKTGKRAGLVTRSHTGAGSIYQYTDLANHGKKYVLYRDGSVKSSVVINKRISW